MENRNLAQSMLLAVILGLSSAAGRAIVDPPTAEMVEEMRVLSERITVLEATCGKP